MKICCKCKESKDESEFAWKNKVKGKLAGECRPCHKLWRDKHYINNRTSEIERIGRRQQEIVVWYREYKKTLVCSKCPETHPACLQFHHRDPEQKEFNLAAAAHGGFGINRLKAEIDKCDVLCANCHAKEHWKGAS